MKKITKELVLDAYRYKMKLSLCAGLFICCALYVIKSIVSFAASGNPMGLISGAFAIFAVAIVGIIPFTRVRQHYKAICNGDVRVVTDVVTKKYKMGHKYCIQLKDLSSRLNQHIAIDGDLYDRVDEGSELSMVYIALDTRPVWYWLADECHVGSWLQAGKTDVQEVVTAEFLAKHVLSTAEVIVNIVFVTIGTAIIGAMVLNNLDNPKDLLYGLVFMVPIGVLFVGVFGLFPIIGGISNRNKLLRGEGTITRDIIIDKFDKWDHVVDDTHHYYYIQFASFKGARSVSQNFYESVKEGDECYLVFANKKKKKCIDVLPVNQYTLGPGLHVEGE